MDPNTAVVIAESGSCALCFTSRDWKVLCAHPVQPNGIRLLDLLGFGSEEEIMVSRIELLLVARDMLELLRRDFDLLQYDYEFHIPARATHPRQRHTGPVTNIKIGGSGHILEGPPGHCYLFERPNYPDGRPTRRTVQDLRTARSLETDNCGTITIHRRRKGLTWTEELPRLIEFLEGVDDRKVRVQNRHR